MSLPAGSVSISELLLLVLSAVNPISDASPWTKISAPSVLSPYLLAFILERIPPMTLP